MKVIVAKTAGFCNGVKYALEMLLKVLREKDPKDVVCTYGPLIHNNHVLNMLRERGVGEINNPEDADGKIVVIRAHGVPPETRKVLYEKAIKVVNATCKRVARVQAVIKQYANKGFHTVIVGDADHAEVVGLKGYAGENGIVIQSAEDIISLPANWKKVLLVAQTTQNEEVFDRISKEFLKKYPGGIVKRTICAATKERQEEVKELARKVDAMIIVGGFHSGNTVRLAEVARSTGTPTYHVETEEDLPVDELKRCRLVGVSAGASTPQWMIHNVVQTLSEL